MAKSAAHHGECGIADRPLGRGVDDVGCLVVEREFHVRILVGRNRAKNVPLSDDADPGTVVISDDRGTNIAFTHRRCDLAQRMTGSDKDDIAAHGFAYEFTFVNQHLELPRIMAKRRVHDEITSAQTLSGDFRDNGRMDAATRADRWSDRRALVVAFVWIPSVMWCDTWVSSGGQLVLGVVTWALLLWWLKHESNLVRAQTVIVVVLATIIEYVFSGWLGVYVYRLDHVPAYVPPGHGLVYLAALTIGRLPFVRAHATAAVRWTVVLAGAWALWGLLLSSRRDVLGLFWYLCLCAFLKWGKSTLLYVGAFITVSYLEILGTTLGVWAWQPVDTIKGWVPMGNPPSIAAGGYGWFDLYATLLAPSLVTVWQRRRSPELPESVDDPVVQDSV